jgi:aminotransferase
MKDFVLKSVKNLKPSGIRQFFDLASEIPGCISLGVGEPDFDTPWHVREEGIYSLEKGNTFYTANSGLKELRIAIANFLHRKYNLNYEPFKEVLVTVGGSEAIDLALRCMVTIGDEVLIPEPSYVAYTPCTLLTGATPITIKLKEENGFRLTKEDLLSNITDKTKVLILPFPNNPTGSILTKQDCLDIASICIEKDIFVISDEIYSELVYDEKHYSIAEIEGMKERCIVINGFSKTYSMTGWRLGYAAGPESIIQAMTKIHQYCIMCAPTTSQFAAIEALNNGDNDIVRMKNEYNQRRRFVLNALNKMNIPCYEPKGAFYVFPNISKFGLTSEEFAKKLLIEEKVITVPGTAFGIYGEGFIRISYAYSIENLKEALSRIEKFISKLSN